MTDLNQETYNAIAEMMEARGYPPSVTELADRLGLSRNSAWARMVRLEKAGMIERVPGSPRAIRLIGETE